MQSTQVTKSKRLILEDGAEEFMQIIGTASSALYACLDAMGYVHQYERKKPPVNVAYDAHWMLRSIIVEVLNPWLISELPDIVTDMSKGIEQLHDNFSSEGFQEDLVEYLVAAINEWESPSEDDLKFVKACVSLGETIKEYHLIWVKEKADEKKLKTI